MELRCLCSSLTIRKITVVFSVFLCGLNTLLGVGCSSAAPFAGAWGDPHFTGWDGVHFDFTGEPGSIYCVLSDANLHINMHLDGQILLRNNDNTLNETRTWVKSLGILFSNHRIILSAISGEDLSHTQSFMGEITVDGEPIRLPIHRKYTSPDGRVTLSYDHRRDHAVLPHDIYTLDLQGVARLRLTVSPEVPEMREEGDAFFHLSFEFLQAELSPSVHGVLGQTQLNAWGRVQQKNSYKTVWNRRLLVQQVEGPNGNGYLDGSASDYISSGLLYSDCSFSRFDAMNYESGNVNPPRMVEVLSGYSRKLYVGGVSELF